MPISPTLNPSDFKHVQNIASALSCISIVGASVALALIIKWKNTFPARLPAYFCAVTLGLCIALFLGTLDIDICYAQAVAIQYFGFAMIVWWFIISFNTYLLIHNQSFQHLERTYLLCGFLIPLLFALLPAMFDTYQHDNKIVPHQLSHNLFANQTIDNWECWLSTQNGSAWPIYVFFDGWMALAFLLGLPLWALSLQRVIALHRSDETLLPSSVIPSTPLLTTPSQTHRSLEAEQSTASILRSYARHLLFIVSFFLVFVVSVVFRSIYYFSTLTYTPMLLHTIAICGTGVFCFFIFGAPHMSACLQAWCPGSESALIDNQQRDVPVQYAIYSQIKSTSTP